MTKLKNKRIIIFLFCAILFPILMTLYYFVPFNVVCVVGNESLKKDMNLYLYQQTDMCCGYEKRELHIGNESVFFIRQEYGEHRFLMNCDFKYNIYGFFKKRAWYDMFIKFHFYSSDNKVYCDVFHVMGLCLKKKTICVDGDSELKKRLDEFVCVD